MRSLIYDVETNGLLRKHRDATPMDRIHCLVMRDAVTRETFRFRRCAAGEYDFPIGVDADGKKLYERRFVEAQDTIAEGVEMLRMADRVIGHNVIHFDNKAIQIVFPDWAPTGEVVDTLVLARMLVPDIKNGDFSLHKAGKLPGWLIGSHSLDAWGYRLGKHKGEYANDMIKRGLDPWASWNPEQEEYCENDISVTEILWNTISQDPPPESAVALEQQIHDIVGQMEANGFFFDLAQAEKLADELRVQIELKSAEVVKSFGSWYKPKKKKIVKIQWEDPNGINAAKTYATPNTAWGEDYSRAVWGDMTFPKKTRRGYGVNTKKKKPGVKTLPDVTEGCPFVAIERVQFNPRSRHHIIDRFTNVYGWTPETFTDAGSPSVDDPVLTKLIETIPEAGPLADILYMEKRYGQIYKGKASWINAYNPDTERIHPYTNTGGTVSGRCAHVAPNIAQVPAVQVAKIKDGKVIDGDKILDLLPYEYIAHGSKAILLGSAGGWGYECRSLFYVPSFINDEEWVEVGVDLSGIEFRCLAERCAKYDGGELIQVVLSGDIHAINMASTGITDRSVVKRVLYGLMYGAGDWKIGHTVAPYASDNQKRALGREIRAKLMRGLPALKKVIDECQEQAEHGFLIGLDGRRLPARSRHSALNLRLQSDAAFVAKKWICLTEEFAFDEGMSHGWRGDFAMLAFIHDEAQSAVKKVHADVYAKLCIKAAAAAGEFFNFNCPIDAESKIGGNWADTH